MLGREVRLLLREDNTACMQVITTGNNPTMRHLERVHNVAVKWIHELYSNKHFDVARVETTAQAADIFTKPFGPSEKVTWLSNMRLINMAYGREFWTAPTPTPDPSEGGGHTPVSGKSKKLHAAPHANNRRETNVCG